MDVGVRQCRATGQECRKVVFPARVGQLGNCVVEPDKPERNFVLELGERAVDHGAFVRC